MGKRKQAILDIIAAEQSNRATRETTWRESLRCSSCRFCTEVLNPEGGSMLPAPVYVCHAAPPVVVATGNVMTARFPHVAPEKPDFWCGMHQPKGTP